MLKEAMAEVDVSMLEESKILEFSKSLAVGLN